jgi:integrase
MAGKTNGVTIRAKSIRLAFTFAGRRYFETLMLNGEPILPTPPNIKHANRLAIEIKEKIKHDVFSLVEYFPANADTQAGNTVAAQLETWLDTQRIELSTKDGYRAAINFWCRTPCDSLGNTVGTRLLRALKVSHIKTAMASRADLTGKTLNNYTSVLREALALGKDDGLLSDNPMDKIKAVPHQKAQPDPFSREELERITTKFAEKHNGQAANFVEFWLWTGLRTSEIQGLNWSNVDLASGSILISEVMVRGLRKERTKTNVARNIKLNSRALAALQAQRQHTQIAGGEVFQDPRYLSAWEDELPFRRSFWTPTLASLGIRYRRPYNMRHTYATTMLMAGMNHSFCAKQMGHSVDQFQRTYTKWIDGEQNDRELELLERAMDAPRKKTSRL